MPFLMLIITGMLSFGLNLHDFIVLAYGVNSGAQALAISRGMTTDPCATAWTAMSNAAPGLTTGSVTLTVSVNGTSYGGFTCTSGAANMVQGATAQVTASYPCLFFIYSLNLPACRLATKTAETIQ